MRLELSHNKGNYALKTDGGRQKERHTDRQTDRQSLLLRSSAPKKKEFEQFGVKRNKMIIRLLLLLLLELRMLSCQPVRRFKAHSIYYIYFFLSKNTVFCNIFKILNQKIRKMNDQKSLKMRNSTSLNSIYSQLNIYAIIFSWLS